MNPKELATRISQTATRERLAQILSDGKDDRYILTLTAKLHTNRPLSLHLEDLEFELAIRPERMVVPLYTTKDYWEYQDQQIKQSLLEFVQANPDGDAHAYLTELQDSFKMPIRLVRQ